jgi:hypothetical protein
MTLRKQWHQFKTNAITETVKNLTNTIRNVNKDIIISASPYGYIGDAKTTYMQDIVTWLEKGYLDLVCPMIYTESVDLLQKTADKYNDYTQKVLQYTGISPIYNGADVLTNQQLCAAIKELNISGIALFASQNYLIPNKATMTKEVREAMPNSSHRGHVITPTSNPNDVFSAWKELFLDRYNRIYKDKLSQQEIEIISYFITATDIQMKTPKDIENVLQQIIMLNAYSDTFSNENVKARILEQTEYIYNILDVAITRHLVRYGYWDMENVEERPNLSTITFKEEIPAGTKTTQTTSKPTQVPTTQIPNTNPSQGNSGINCKKANVSLTDVLLTISSSIALVGACCYLYKRK